MYARIYGPPQPSRHVGTMSTACDVVLNVPPMHTYMHGYAKPKIHIVSTCVETPATLLPLHTHATIM
jgi:hypothetical protein